MVACINFLILHEKNVYLWYNIIIKNKGGI